MIDFDYTTYVTGTTLCLENMKIMDCRITDIQCENIEIKNCQFENVIFENYFKWIGITTPEYNYEKIAIQNCIFKKTIFRNVIERKLYSVDECEFIECEFFDKFLQVEQNSVLISMSNNVYRNCLLDGVSYIGYFEQCDYNNHFENCQFRNIFVNGDISVGGLIVIGGKMEQIEYNANSLYESCFSELEIENANLQAGWSGNRMKQVIFKNVTISGLVKHKIDEFIRFADCSMEGLTIKEDDLQ